MPNQYTEFVKMHFHDKKYAGMTPQQRMQKLAEEYRKGKPAMAKAPKLAPRPKRERKARGGEVSAGGIGADVGNVVDAVGSLFGLGLEKKKGRKARGGEVSAGEMTAGRMRKQKKAGEMTAGKAKKVKGAGAISSALASLLPF